MGSSGIDRIDLHGYPVHEALEVFLLAYNGRVTAGSRQPIEVVHGYGASGEGGIIRIRLRAFLDAYPGRVSYQAGEDIDGNPGYTLVFPKSLLPTNLDLLRMEILAYCATPKTEDKIFGKFRQHGDEKVMVALKVLVKNGKLEVKRKGKYRIYQTIG